VDRPHPIARFTPLRRAARWRYALLYSLGPLVWVVALVLVSIDIRRGNAVVIGVTVLAGSLLLSLVILLPMRWRRVRRNRRG
jgi:hypothetical protein